MEYKKSTCTMMTVNISTNISKTIDRLLQCCSNLCPYFKWSALIIISLYILHKIQCMYILINRHHTYKYHQKLTDWFASMLLLHWCMMYVSNVTESELDLLHRQRNVGLDCAWIAHLNKRLPKDNKLTFHNGFDSGLLCSYS